MVTVRHALQRDVDALAGSLARAFADDPVMRWMASSLADPHPFLVAWFRFVVEHGLSQGHCYLAEAPGHPDAPAAGAVWTPPDVELFDGAAAEHLVGLVVTHLGEDEGMAKLRALSAVGEAHPEVAHFYLFIAGTDPAHRGRGVGADLLARVLATCDAEGLPAYLESSNPRNVPFYERLGFRVTGDIALGEGAPVLQPMWRDPQP